MESASSVSATASVTDFHSKSESRSLPLWPKAVVALGFVLSAVWTLGLGYGLVKLIALVI